MKKRRYKVTELGEDGRAYWIDLGDRAELMCFDTKLLLEREPPHETFTAHAALRTIFPIVDFEDTSVDEMADFVRMHSRQIRPPGLNIVIIPRELGERRIPTLRLRDAPVASFMKYVAELTGMVVSFEDDAIVLRDAEAGEGKKS